MTRPSRHSRTRPSRGFTLIELLVGLAVLGMMAAMLVAGLGTVGMMAQRARTTADLLEPITAAQLVLRGRLERLRATPRLTSSQPIVDIAGDSRAFIFTGAPPDKEMPDALFRYRLERTTGGDVTLYSAPVLADGADASGGPIRSWDAIRLAQGTAGLQIAYFGSDLLSGAGRWLDRWENRPQPPDLIRVRIAFPAGDRRVWPDLVVRPRATVNNACRIDALSGRCEEAS